ncbi:MAG: hypothetical protein QXU18_15875, partial [Thermoplasmatales archaeon]
MEHAFEDCKNVRSHSSVEYLTPKELERMWNENSEFKEDFLERKRVKHEREMRRREEKKMSYLKPDQLYKIRGLKPIPISYLFQNHRVYMTGSLFIIINANAQIQRFVSYLPSSLVLKYAASMQMNLIALSILLSRNDFTLESSSDASADTYDADMFSTPNDSTTLMTFLVETPCMYDSSITEL